MRDHGHGHADQYPIAMVTDEAGLVVERVNAAAGAQAALQQLVLASVPSMGVKPASTTKIQRQLDKVLTALRGDSDE